MTICVQCCCQNHGGHADMCGAVLTPPVTQGADAGLVFFDNGGYLDMCGHATICATVALTETGRIAGPQARFDTPNGPIDCSLMTAVAGPDIVRLHNAPAFVAEMDVPLALPDFGRVVPDVAFGGNFFALVPADEPNRTPSTQLVRFWLTPVNGTFYVYSRCHL